MSLSLSCALLRSSNPQTVPLLFPCFFSKKNMKPNKDSPFPPPAAPPPPRYLCCGGGRARHRAVPITDMCLFNLDLLLFLVLVLSCFSSVLACDQLDRDSLLSFSFNISSNPPLDWTSSADCCLWEGIACDAANASVTSLSLPFRGLSGVISGALLNLTRLTYLNLSHNGLLGPLPTGFFSSLAALQVLDLSFNRLAGDSPFSSLSNSSSSSIETLDLSSNRFRGEIPASFFEKAWNLTSFNVSNNIFTGAVPSPVCSAPSRALVSALDLSDNHFSGNLPAGLGQCSLLQTLKLGFNNLSGPIPDEIYSVTALEHLSLAANYLSGAISNSIAGLTNLRTLELYANHFTGPIPPDIGKLTNLDKLSLYINNLTGPLPPSLTSCSKLKTLNLRVNSLTGNITQFNFSAFKSLVTLDLGNNNFSGYNLPPSLFSCKSLSALRFASNRIEGQVSPDITQLQSLSFLSVSNNKLVNFTGAIKILMGCKSLGTLILSKNYFGESMPEDENLLVSDGFQKLQVLGLGGCQFSGRVPAWLFKITNLEVLDLSQNRITGEVPSQFGTMPNLFYLDLSDNYLVGGFPSGLSKLVALSSKKADDTVDRSYLELPVFVMPDNVTNQQYNQLASLPPAIYLRNNNLTGPIPPEIGLLKFLLVLDLSNNSFSGSIPDEISNLTNLEILDLSSNHLSGEIPASLGRLHFLSSFSVAFNDLVGTIPSGSQFDTFPLSSFQGNPGLCGAVLSSKCSNDSGKGHNGQGRKRLDKKLIAGVVIGIFFGTCFVMSVVALWILSKRRIAPGGDADKTDWDGASINSSFGDRPPQDTSLVQLFRHNASDIKDLTIFEIMKATDYFDQANIIGCGGFGLVYKATLDNGTKLAVKKLSGDMGMMEREFGAEVQVLSTAKHDNLVSLQGYCVHEGCRLLIYTYMENGSLDHWLHEKPEGASQLEWPVRLKILQGAARGVAYMHLTCEPHIVHRDIKSSNILLDEKFEAHVADFGLSRLIHPYSTHVTTELVGTLGYIPPEYGQQWIATLRGDMYSFGVVMLEMISGRRPMEVFKPKASRELVPWVLHMRSEGKEEEVFDPLMKGKGFEQEMRRVLDVACMCVSYNPFRRPTIKEVVDWLSNVP